MKKQNKVHLDWVIAFWAGVAVLSLINMIMNLKQAAQTQGALAYNQIIFGISIIILIVGIILLTKNKNGKTK